MKLHFLVGSALVFGIPLVSVGLQRLFPDSKITAGCAAGSNVQPNTAACIKCAPTTCTPPTGGHRVDNGDGYTTKGCIDWDGIYPPHCLSVPVYLVDLYDADWENLGSCAEKRCAQSSGSNPPACSDGYHP